MTVPYIVPIIALLAFVYFISYQEDKSTTHKEFKAFTTEAIELDFCGVKK